MSNTKLNCCKCGKEFELTERIYASGDLWQCEDCAIKQMQENDEKEQKIADLEAKLEQKDKQLEKLKSENHALISDNAYQESDIFELNSHIEQLQKQLVESETKRKSLEEKVKFITEEKEENFVDGQKYNELKEQLVESEKLKESYRLQNEQHHLQLLQFYSRLGVEAFGADIHEKALETLMIMKDQLEESKEENKKLVKALNGDIFINYKVPMENTKLKQQLHDLPKKIVCEISEAIERLSWRKRIYTNWEFDKEQLYKDLDTILKKYGEKYE